MANKVALIGSPAEVIVYAVRKQVEELRSEKTAVGSKLAELNSKIEEIDSKIKERLDWLNAHGVDNVSM